MKKENEITSCYDERPTDFANNRSNFPSIRLTTKRLLACGVLRSGRVYIHGPTRRRPPRPPPVRPPALRHKIHPRVGIFPELGLLSGKMYIIIIEAERREDARGRAAAGEPEGEPTGGPGKFGFKIKQTDPPCFKHAILVRE
ncbi:hypothetical protein Bbelb_204200 [Branchiostoma belcheri]|nr:hypothetical protein Bbelb_204200 [Branchiostoma belcheri]